MSTFLPPANILRCPITHGSLRELTAVEIEQINSRCAQGEVRHYDGSPVRKTLVSGFISEDSSFAYLVEDDVAILLPHLALALKPASSVKVKEFVEEKRIVRDFYEQLGWHKDDGGQFVDTAKFGDRRGVLDSYRMKCALRLARNLQSGGKYILDAASGPMHNPEYLVGQGGYEKRICVDFSFLALQEAKKRLGDKGIYLLADVTELPIRDSVMDAVVSLHTVYHVPATEQKLAIEEIHRVLRPNCSAVVVYTWGENSKLMNLAFLPAQVWQAFTKRVRLLRRDKGQGAVGGKASSAQANTTNTARLYSHTHSYQYFKGVAWGFDFDIMVWSSLNRKFTQKYIGKGSLSRGFLALVGWLEDIFPRSLGRWGQYPLFVIRKT